MNIELVAGTTFVEKLLSPIDDLTDYDVYLEVRKKLTDSAPFFVVNSEAPNGNGSVIDVDTAGNSITITINSKETVDLAGYGKDLDYFWDMRFVHDSGKVFVMYPASNFRIKRVSTRVGKDLV